MTSVDHITRFLFFSRWNIAVNIYSQKYTLDLIFKWKNGSSNGNYIYIHKIFCAAIYIYTFIYIHIFIYLYIRYTYPACVSVCSFAKIKCHTCTPARSGQRNRRDKTVIPDMYRNYGVFLFLQNIRSLSSTGRTSDLVPDASTEKSPLFRRGCRHLPLIKRTQHGYVRRGRLHDLLDTFTLLGVYAKRTRSLKLTVVKPSKDRSVILPAVMVSRFCERSMRKSKIRHSLGVRSYQRDSYAASLMDLLCNGNQLSRWIACLRFLLLFFVSLLFSLFSRSRQTNAGNFKDSTIATITLVGADLSAEMLSGVAEHERFEGNRDVEDQGLRYHRRSVLRTDRLRMRNTGVTDDRTNQCTVSGGRAAIWAISTVFKRNVSNKCLRGRVEC